MSSSDNEINSAARAGNVQNEAEGAVFVRINGVLPATGGFRDGDRSAGSANTSCSLFASAGGSSETGLFHLLVDIGRGVIDSITAGKEIPGGKVIPDALLITHAHDDHVSDIAKLPGYVTSQARAGMTIQVYCTKECRDDIAAKYPSVLKDSQNILQFNTIEHGKTFEAGPFAVTPIRADHSTANASAESTIFLIRTGGTKIIAGWDFRSLPGVDENMLWNPTLAILGAESYNDHPSATGMISVSEACVLAKRWNAKECFLVHYSGLADLEDKKNQWFRGPTGPMTAQELQDNVDGSLRVADSEGKFKVTVAKEGMIWSSEEYHRRLRDYYAKTGTERSTTEQDSRIGSHLEIESLQKYWLKFDKLKGQNRLKLTIEDRINRFEPEFESPRRNQDGTVLTARPIKGMFAKGPELKKMKVIMRRPDEGREGQAAGTESLLDVEIVKGKKSVFQEQIPITGKDAQLLQRYINENFDALSETVA